MADRSAPEAPEGTSNALVPTSPRVIALILASAIFMEQVDSTAIATALPSMAVSLGVPALSLSAAVTAYLVSLAVFIPISGAMADRLGSRTVFRLAIGVFTLGSILCGMADSVWFLIGSRVVQGIGGAMMVPCRARRARSRNRANPYLDWLANRAALTPRKSRRHWRAPGPR